MSDLNDHIAYEVHEFLRSYDCRGDSAFKIALAEGCERLIQANKLSLGNLKKLSLPARFFTINEISKEKFLANFLPYAQKFSPASMGTICEAYDDFFESIKTDLERDHAGQILNRGHPKEDLGQHLIHIALTTFTRKKGFVYREVPSGAGRIDIIVAGKIEIVVETKLSRNFKGTKQLADYINNSPKTRRGYFVIFDHTKGNNLKGKCDVSGGRLHSNQKTKTVVVHINPPLPSTQKHKVFKKSP